LLNLTESGPSDGSHYQQSVFISAPATNILFQYNEQGNILNHGAAIVFNNSGTTVTNNWFHDIDQIGVNPWNGASNYLVGQNRLEYISIKRDGGTVWYNVPASGIYNDGGNTGIIERNFVSHAGVGIEALAEPGNPAAHDVTIRNNVAEYCQQGIVLGTWYSSTDGSSVYNINVWNNTFYANAIGMIIRPMVSSTVAWRNNIFAKNVVTYINRLRWNPGTVGYNVYFGGGSGPGTNNLTSDPLFVRASTGNFSLQSASPAINAGDKNSSATVVGTVDFAGNPRIAGGRIDIGAYEVQ
jgi:hypothetical protein